MRLILIIDLILKIKIPIEHIIYLNTLCSRQNNVHI